VLVGKNLPPAGDDKLRLSGTFQVSNLPPAFNPLLSGLSFAVYGQGRAPIFSGFIPPGLRIDTSGAGWRSNNSGTRWSYKDSAGIQTPGLQSVRVAHKINIGLGVFSVSLSGKYGDFHVEPSDLPLRFDIVLGGAAEAGAGQCGSFIFNPETGERPNCEVRQEGKTIKCN
jgi:hypothetical protein